MSGKHAFSHSQSGPRQQSGRSPGPRSLAGDIAGMQSRFRPDMNVYNTKAAKSGAEGLPVGGAAPGEADQVWQTKLDMLNAPENYGLPADGLQYSITDGDAHRTMKRQKDLQQAGFFEYLSEMVDIRQPGMLSWLNDLVPEYAEAMMAQLKSNQELYAMATKIKHFGINSREDLLFQYMIDANIIRDTNKYERGKYIPGWLVPRGLPALTNDKAFAGFDKLGTWATTGTYSRNPGGAWDRAWTAGGSASQKPTFA